MGSKNQTHPDEQQEQVGGMPIEPVESQEQESQEALRRATVVAAKALLHEIKTLNKAGRPVMRIHEPRQRFDTGSVLKVLPDEIVADGGVIYLLCVDHPDLYVRKIDVSVSEG